MENTMRKFGISEFSTKPTNFYNLDMIIAIGFVLNQIAELNLEYRLTNC